MNARLYQVTTGISEKTLCATGGALGVWFFGCSVGCKGCATPGSWGSQGREEALTVPVEALLRLAVARDAKALVVSGGEPTEQAPAVEALVAGYKARFPDRETLLFSGLRYQRLQRQFGALLRHFDTVVAGPFVQDLATGAALVASSNQELVMQTDLARGLYKGFREWPAPRQQLASRWTETGIELVTVGIPRASSRAAQPIHWQAHKAPAVFFAQE